MQFQILPTCANRSRHQLQVHAAADTRSMTQHEAEPRQGTGSVPGFSPIGTISFIRQPANWIERSMWGRACEKTRNGASGGPCPACFQGYETRPCSYGTTEARGTAERQTQAPIPNWNWRRTIERNSVGMADLAHLSAQIQLIALKCSFCTHSSRKLRETKQNAWFHRLGRSGIFSRSRCLEPMHA